MEKEIQKQKTEEINPFADEPLGMKRYSYNGESRIGNLVEIRGMFLIFESASGRKFYVRASIIDELTASPITPAPRREQLRTGAV